jgi:transcriptional regulator of acetoin/glycerol metabolism
LRTVIERAVILSKHGELDLAGFIPQPTASMETSPAARQEDQILTAAELRELEAGNLLRALQAAGWRISGPRGAARMLGVPPSTLASRMEALGIRRPR